MARQNSLTRVASLERQEADLHRRKLAAKREARERKKADDARRAAVLGAAIIASFSPEILADIIRKVVPKKVKAKADLQLFAAWLTTDQIAAGTDEKPVLEVAATEPG